MLNPPPLSDLNFYKTQVKLHILSRIGVFARGQIMDISPKGLQAGHFDAPGIMSAVRLTFYTHLRDT